MNNRDNLALLLLMFMIPLICGQIEEGGFSTCDKLRMECPNPDENYTICESASDLRQDESGGIRYYSYYNCELGIRTQTLTAPTGCEPSFR